ncbi:MAG: hypothetical protein EA360_12120 [Balneolaceae bacterium]|nr:MAG: hypothetical protein EA360_12120 [Balneolaceae bacterium]
MRPIQNREFCVSNRIQLMQPLQGMESFEDISAGFVAPLLIEPDMTGNPQPSAKPPRYLRVGARQKQET